ncbi:MAG: YdcF family protein [Lachnospiraceae bacterium]|nr:YdcF family protein [Lachnospiraceae bacterium]
MTKDHIKRWNFICSYTGILTSGFGIFLIAFIIYLVTGAYSTIPFPAVIPFNSAEISGTLTGSRITFEAILTRFPATFLIWILPLIILINIFFLITTIELIRREGFRPQRLLGVGFGIGCIIINILCRSFLFTSLLACYFFCVFIGTSIMGVVAVKHKPSLDNDFLIILGCYIGNKGKLMPLLRSRLNRAIHFAWEQEIATGKAIKYIPSGGQGGDEVMSEGSAMSLYLLSHGAENYEILAEKESVNTYENMLFSKRIIDSQMPDAKVSFITTNFHVLRSGMFAKKAGLNAEGIASATKWYYWPTGYIREFIAIVLMHKKVQLIALISCALLTAISMLL